MCQREEFQEMHWLGKFNLKKFNRKNNDIIFLKGNIEFDVY